MLKKFDLKILYVEDDKTLSEQFKTFFERRCKTLVLANNGKEGLDLFIKESPHIVISDIRMPIMDGLEMIKEIRKINNKIPIIVTSAFNEQDYLLEAINLGVTRYILKPFNRTILREIVEDTINYVNLTLNEKIHTAEIEAIYDNIKEKTIRKTIHKRSTHKSI